jgi:FkbH-like protein
MVSLVKPFDAFTIPRVAQLTQRSNQFNLRTMRYTDSEIHAISESKDYFTCSFTLEDKYGDYGLINVIILRKQQPDLFIDTWIMSCRVLQRGMERFVLNQIVSLALQNGYKELIGEYIPTPKNGMVQGHYKNLGFTRLEGDKELFRLNTEQYSNHKTFITSKQRG